jgi:ribosomal protein S18 acetylase RimI-like enzyme
MEGLVVREARPEDLEELLRLWLQMVELHGDLDPSLRMRTDAEALESARTYLRAGLESPDSKLFVAEVAGMAGLVGFLLAHVRPISPLALPPSCGSISDICVDERLRRQGAGRQLFLAAREWFQGRGQTVIRLHVATANPAGQSFWRAMGGTEQMVLMRVEL